MDNKTTILITGASKGIGLEIVNHYLALGYNVISISRTPSAEKENHTQYLADITNENEVMQVIKELKIKKTIIDVLINNAGVATMNFMVSTPLAKVTEIFNTNFVGMFLITREVSKMMIAKNKGRIINISSVSVPLHMEWQSVYAASKAALEEFTRIIAKELAPFNITANILGPNPIDTNLIKNIPDANLNLVINQQAIKRKGEVKDIIHCLDFFMDKKSDCITGQTIYLNGVF
jgi:3-oxoacyl-[acyl-carrier protein] reductase